MEQIHSPFISNNHKNEHQLQKEDEEEGVDFFDYLPDPILLLMFNKLSDAKSLHRCLLVSKRFASLVTQVDSISISFDSILEKPTKPIEEASILRSGSRSVSKNIFRNLFSKFINKPFQFIVQVLGKKNGSSNDSSIDYINWVSTALKSFNEIQSLKLELPINGGDSGLRKIVSLLKWETHFGKELNRCLIIGGNSVLDKKDKIFTNEGGIVENEQTFSDDELKLRIIWIISCLIASSARHNLLKRIVLDCPRLESAVISDVGKQGKLILDSGEIKELRDSIKSSIENNNNNNNNNNNSSTSELQMGYVGNLVMKLWYVKELELPSCGKVIKGATLVAIRTENKVEKEEEWGNLKGAFEGDDMFGEAAKELMKRKEKRMYRLEMNSF